jgi:hypothetical protein
LWLNVWTGNNDPDLIEKYYLEAVLDAGVFPFNTRSDYGSETIGIYKVQHALHDLYGTAVDKPHTYVTSTRNTKIESLWGRYLKEWGRTLMEHLEFGCSTGIYTSKDCLEEYLFLYIWIPLVQNELDRYKLRCNNQRRQKSRQNVLPTCAPVFAYKNPTHFGAMNCGYNDDTLVGLVKERIQKLTQQENLRDYIPLDFKLSADEVHQMIDAPEVKLENAWEIFVKMRFIFNVFAC